METINYFWQFVFQSLVVALFSLATVSISIAIIVAVEKWIAVRKQYMKYVNGYRNAINDAIADVNRLYDEYNSDEIVADIPTQKNIVARLERLKYENARRVRK